MIPQKARAPIAPTTEAPKNHKSSAQHIAVFGEDTTDPTILRLAKRAELFKRRGLGEQAAVDLAETLRRRDDDLDDRRMCIECAHLQSDGGCFAARQGWIQGAAVYLAPVRTMLQRCERFESQGVSC